MTTSFRFVYITFPTEEEARNLGRKLVELRHVACVNILPISASIYRWEGKITEEKEVALIAKTDALQLDALVEVVKANHPYSCPCVIALPIEKGNPAYLEWIAESVNS